MGSYHWYSSTRFWNKNCNTSKKGWNRRYYCTKWSFRIYCKKIKANIRELEGALTRIVAYSSLTNREISVDLTSEALKDIISSSRPKQVTVDLIKDVVSQYYNIRTEEFNSKRRTRSISFPRQIAMYLSRELTDLSLPKIGEEFGGRDHTTVIHAYEKITKDKDKDLDLSNKIEQIRKEIIGE